MRRRIYNLANGKFEYDSPRLSFSTERLELQVLEGQKYKGSFTIQSENGIPMRGIVYTSNARMECLNPQFEGLTAQIQFEFHSEGLIEGNIQQGDFYIICNQNEYNLSFVVNISKLYAESSIGKIRTLYDFAKLAEKDRREAYEIFTSPMFTNIIKTEERRERMLYEGLAKSHASMQNLEEFLVGIKQKAKVMLSLEKKEAEYVDLEDTIKEEFKLVKNQWGYIEIELSSDADFLNPVKDKITVDDFIGSTAKIEYLIEKEKLHAGKNYGQIQIKNPYQTLLYTVCVHQSLREDEERTGRIRRRRMRTEFMESYLNFRLERITSGVWAEDALQRLELFIEEFPKEHWYGLMKAQVYLVNSQRQEAEWILDEKKKEIADKNSPQWAYYLYLTTLLIREEKYEERILQQVEEICRHNPKDLRLSWILLFLRKDYAENAFGKYHALKERIMGGCMSPYFYVEAYLLFAKETYTLMELGDFECRILLWAVRKKVLTAVMAEQVMRLAGDRRAFEKRVYKILCGCYEVCDSDEMLTVICAYLIKGQKYEEVYHHWYAKGIERDLRLAGLYEAFVYSMDRQKVQKVPQMVQMYFRYHSSLPYTKKAALYVNIIANKESQPSVYASYERTMENFALEQILERHMDDNLAIIYDEFLKEPMIQKETAAALSELLFYHKLTCFDENAVRLYVVHRQLKDGMTVPLVGGVAYFPIYSSEYVILLEDRNGNRYVSGMDYQLEKLMKPGKYIRRCIEQAPECLPYAIYLLDKRPAMEDDNEDNIEFLQRFFRSEKISEAYHCDLCPVMIQLYQKYQVPLEEKDILQRVNPSLLNQSARKAMVELFIDRENYKLAYEWMQMYGFEQLEPVRLMAVASYMAEIEEYEEEEFLSYLCAAAFFGGKYNEAVLGYLCCNYDGPAKVLGEIWCAAKELGVDTYELEERALVQIIYSTEYVPHTEEIFESYCRNGGKEVIKEAYINYFAHAYFTENQVLPAPFLQYLAEREEAGIEQNEICRLAVLRYLAVNQEEQREHLELIDRCLEEFVSKNQYFAFYKQLPIELQQKYGFEDKVFVEYHSKNREKVWIHYHIEEKQDYEEREMSKSYEGIYVSGFQLFFGERIQYYISQKNDVENVIIESNQIMGNEFFEEENKSRYALLNHMRLALTFDEDKKAEDCMLEYIKKQEISKEIFQIL